LPVTTILELIAALALIVGGIILYRRRGREDPQHGSQSAVLLLVLGAILAIHGLGLLDYRPSPSEIGQ
jgi:flagellar biogenesis protein FliO